MRQTAGKQWRIDSCWMSMSLEIDGRFWRDKLDESVEERMRIQGGISFDVSICNWQQWEVGDEHITRSNDVSEHNT